jgi:hypothetical protein
MHNDEDKGNNIFKQVGFRIEEKLYKDFTAKLKRESKSLTLFFQNMIKEFMQKKP